MRAKNKPPGLERQELERERLKLFALFNGIWKQDLDGTPPRRLEGLPEEKLFSYGWSADGKLFAYSRGLTTRDVVLIKGQELPR